MGSPCQPEAAQRQSANPVLLGLTLAMEAQWGPRGESLRRLFQWAESPKTKKPKIKKNSKGRKHSGSPERPASQRTLLALPGALGEEELVLFVGEICREESVHHGAETRGVEKGSMTEIPQDVLPSTSAFEGVPHPLPRWRNATCSIRDCQEPQQHILSRDLIWLYVTILQILKGKKKEHHPQERRTHPIPQTLCPPASLWVPSTGWATTDWLCCRARSKTLAQHQSRESIWSPTPQSSGNRKPVRCFSY